MYTSCSNKTIIRKIICSVVFISPTHRDLERRVLNKERERERQRGNDQYVSKNIIPHGFIVCLYTRSNTKENSERAGEKIIDLTIVSLYPEYIYIYIYPCLKYGEFWRGSLFFFFLSKKGCLSKRIRNIYIYIYFFILFYSDINL